MRRFPRGQRSKWSKQQTQRPKPDLMSVLSLSSCSQPEMDLVQKMDLEAYLVLNRVLMAGLRGTFTRAQRVHNGDQSLDKSDPFRNKTWKGNLVFSMKCCDNAFRTIITQCYYFSLYQHERERSLKLVSRKYRKRLKQFLDISVNNVINLACKFPLYCWGRLPLGCFLFLLC